MGALPLSAQSGDLVAVLHTRDALNYSLMHNQVPLISAITVRQRHVDQVPYEELRQVMVHTLRQAFRAPEEEILRSAARLYGHQRMGTRIQARLEEVFQRALAEGAIISTGADDYEPNPPEMFSRRDHR